MLHHPVSALMPTVKVIEQISLLCREKYMKLVAVVCVGTDVLAAETQGMKSVLAV